MTDKELKKLKRTELLELMYYLRKELDNVKNENEALRSQLEVRAAEQADVNKEILNTVHKITEQLDAIYKVGDFKNIKEPLDSKKSGKKSSSEKEETEK